MLNIMRLCLGTIARLFCARRSLLLENLALRQQLAAFKRRHPRTRLTFLDKLFWIADRQICPDWQQFLIVVVPDTVVQWHRSPSNDPFTWRKTAVQHVSVEQIFDESPGHTARGEEGYGRPGVRC